MDNRESWLDIAKGLGIIAVVVGHSGSELAHTYLFWFHMPLFFIISGFLYKQRKDYRDLQKWTSKRTKQLLIPYFCFGILLSVFIFLTQFSLQELFTNAAKLLYGGELLYGYFGVFWFITCLFLTQIIFGYINLEVKSFVSHFLIVVVFYVLAHLISSVADLREFPVPWNFDAVFLAYIYYFIGYYGKSLIKDLSKRTSTLVVTSLLSAFFIVLNEFNYMNFSFDMKINSYSYAVLDLLIPVTFTMLIFSLSSFLSKINRGIGLSYLGTQSLIIMYLHIPTTIVITKFVDLNIFSFTIAGLVIPLIFTYLFNAFNITRRLFLGQVHS